MCQHMGTVMNFLLTEFYIDIIHEDLIPSDAIY
jgi:hypothetical protein